MSFSLTIGPNDEQKKRGEKFVRQGKRTSGLGFLLMLIGVLYFLYKFSLAHLELEISGISIFFGWILAGNGGRARINHFANLPDIKPPKNIQDLENLFEFSFERIENCL